MPKLKTYFAATPSLAIRTRTQKSDTSLPILCT